MFCKNCGVEIDDDITNPLSLCDDCEKTQSEKFAEDKNNGSK